MPNWFGIHICSGREEHGRHLGVAPNGSNVETGLADAVRGTRSRWILAQKAYHAADVVVFRRTKDGIERRHGVGGASAKDDTLSTLRRRCARRSLAV